MVFCRSLIRIRLRGMRRTNNNREILDPVSRRRRVNRAMKERGPRNWRSGSLQARTFLTHHTMHDETPFPELIRRIRTGDADAAAELVRQYEPAVRRSLRLRLDPRLRRTCDSMDLSQAVLCSFFVRAAVGQFQLDTPEQL